MGEAGGSPGRQVSSFPQGLTRPVAARWMAQHVFSLGRYLPARRWSQEVGWAWAGLAERCWRWNTPRHVRPYLLRLSSAGRGQDRHRHVVVLVPRPSEWKTSGRSPGLGPEAEAEGLGSARRDAWLAEQVEHWYPGLALVVWLGRLLCCGHFFQLRLSTVSFESPKVVLDLTRGSFRGSLLGSPVVLEIPSHRHETSLLFVDLQCLGVELFRQLVKTLRGSDLSPPRNVVQVINAFLRNQNIRLTGEGIAVLAVNTCSIMMAPRAGLHDV